MYNFFFKQKYTIAFFLYAFIGWLYEVALEFFLFHHGFVNRGFLYGPYLPVYGFGALLILIALYPCYTRTTKLSVFQHEINITPVLTFFGIVILTTILELITSYLMDGPQAVSYGIIMIMLSTFKDGLH